MNPIPQIPTMNPSIPFRKPPTVSDDYRAVDLYRQAAEVFFHRGFAATSMGDIAAAVDLTQGGLFYYIKGKEALLFAIMSYGLDLLETEVIHPARCEDDPERRLASLVACQARLSLDEVAVMSLLANEEDGLEAGHRGKIRQRKAAHADFLADTVSAVTAGEPGRRLDPRLAAHGLLGLVGNAVRWQLRHGEPSSEEAVSHLCRLALHGVVPPQPA